MAALRSSRMVQKHSLKIILYPSQYKLCWLQKGSEIKVSTRCLVEFSIGKYKDEVCCDVAPMEPRKKWWLEKESWLDRKSLTRAKECLSSIVELPPIAQRNSQWCNFSLYENQSKTCLSTN